MNEPELIKDSHQKKFSGGFFISLIFIGLFLFLVYTSFYDTAGFTKKISGNFIDAVDKEDGSEQLRIRAELDVPDQFVVDSSARKLSFKLKEAAAISVGTEHIDLEKDASFIVDNFNGRFIVAGGAISQLEGTASEVFVNGISLKDKSGETISISFDELTYNYARFDEITLSEINYAARGILYVNEDKLVMRFNNEPFYLEDYEGNMELGRNYLRLEGKSGELNMQKLFKKYSLNSSY